jgi:glycosyltransferase involved in cell wall biosynthesis
VAHRRIPDPPSASGLLRLARADAVLCVSDEIRRRLLALGVGCSGQPRLETVHSSADALSLAGPACELPGSPVLGYLGWFRRHKGLDLLLDALPAVRHQHPGLKLHLVGTGDEEGALREQVRRLGLAACVTFHPFQDQPGPWLAAFDLFILPSREEGLGSVALQAQALGVPVLGTLTGGLPEGVAHDRTGWLVEAGSAPALSAGLLEALEDPARLQAWGEAGPAWVEQGFSPAAMARRTLELYRELGA